MSTFGIFQEPFLSLDQTFLRNLFYGFAVIFSLGVLSTWRIANYAERKQWWTLRLRLSLWQPYVLASWILYTSTVIVSALYSWRSSTPESRSQTIPSDALVALAASITFIMGVDLTLRAFETRHYMWLRWKAWTGPSRTGIPPELVKYIGNSEDWAALVWAGGIQQHPVDRFSGSFWGKSKGIVVDATDLLRTRAALDQGESLSWTPQSQDRPGVYQPIVDHQSVSILWGEHLGFQRRCSRGIISVPPNLLKASPSLKSGLAGNAICLAYGILARNKGLEPSSLICNLGVKNSFRAFEEGGRWPRPAKTLRSFYFSEFSRAFSLLGQSYVTAATELALLLADSVPALIDGWLGSHFEHQDLLLNLDVQAMGASQEDLQRIYRGHYAAMLVSLSLYRKGIRIRPEITVFDAVCKFENVHEYQPSWIPSNYITRRRQQELNEYGPALRRLVDAVI